MSHVTSHQSQSQQQSKRALMATWQGSEAHRPGSHQQASQVGGTRAPSEPRSVRAYCAETPHCIALSVRLRRCQSGAARLLRSRIADIPRRLGVRAWTLLVLTSALALLPPVRAGESGTPPAASTLSSAQPAPPASAGSSDPLGVWLTTVDSDVLRDQEAARRASEELSRNGFSRAALPLYSGGHVTWPLDPSQNPFGLALDPDLPTPDHALKVLRELGKDGLVRVGWMEFGLMAPDDAPWLRDRQDLLLRDRAGGTLWAESPRLNRVWLNPARPEVQAFLEALVVDACTRLPLEMIQFDDHLGYPSRFGYDATTLALWRATRDGAVDPTPDPDAPAWLRLRADQVTALLQRLRGAMRRSCPQVKLSLAPNPREFSYRSSLADWPSWIRLGLVDELVVQIYRWDPRALEHELADAGLRLARQQLPVRIGLLAGLRGQPKDDASLQRELEAVRAQGYGGIDLFFYETVRSHLPLKP